MTGLIRDNFRYLNREGKWLNFHWRGLEVSPEGALRLLSSPRLASPIPTPTQGTMPSAPQGIAIDDSGRLFYSMPDEDRIVAIGGCDPSEKSLPCLAEGSGLNGLKKPRGLLVLHNPDRLVIVDSGNNRLLFFDLVDFELREVWGNTQANSLPNSPETADRFLDPWSVTADEAGNIYVLDNGNRRVLKFRRTGEPDNEFLENLQSSGLVPYPEALAVHGKSDDTLVFVFDLDANSIFVFDGSGHPVVNSEGFPITLEVPGMGNVLALAASDTTLYVGDNAQQRILAFSLTDGFPFSGDAAGFKGFVTALAVDAPNHKLLVNTGQGATPLVLDEHGAYLGFGFLWSDAIQVKAAPVNWDRLRATVSKVSGSHIAFFYATSDSLTIPPIDTASENPFSDSRWQAGPLDVEDFLLGEEKKPFLFVAAIFFSDRTGTPSLRQMRVEFDSDSFTRYLPAIYREPSLAAVEKPADEPPTVQKNGDFLRRFVGLFQGLFEDVEGEVDSLERYFDPYAAPADALPWLATWLAVELDFGEPESRIRESIARAFRRYQWRGTITGLRLALLEDAGVHANISEPIAGSAFFAMPPPTACGAIAAPTGAELGLSTSLTSMEPGGAVLGSTAQLDHSYLITDSQYGEPVFSGAASQFVVEVRLGEVNTQAKLELVRTIIDREKPAHTMYRLVVIDPSMRVGFQSRVGVDSIVSGQSGPTPLGEEGGFGLRLGGSFQLRIGTSRLGQDLKL